MRDYHGSFEGGMGKYHPTFWGTELQYLPKREALREVLQAQSRRMLDGIFPYLPKKNHGKHIVIG